MVNDYPSCTTNDQSSNVLQSLIYSLGEVFTSVNLL